MGEALKAVIGGDSTPLQRELQLVEQLAKRSADKLANQQAQAFGNKAYMKATRGAKAMGGIFEAAVSGGMSLERLPMEIMLAAKNMDFFVRGAKMGGRAVVSTFGAVAGVFAGLAIGIVAGAAATKYLIKGMTELKAIDFKVDHIAKIHQASSAAAQAQKEINKELEKTVRLYDGAQKSAERIAEVQRINADHNKKMLDLAEQEALARATKQRRSEFEKQAIRERFARERLSMDIKQRDAEIALKKREEVELLAESRKRKSEADNIKVDSKEHGEQLLAQKKKAADEAEAYIKEIRERGVMARAGEAVKRFAATRLGAAAGITSEDIVTMQLNNMRTAAERIQVYKKAKDEEAEREIIRKRKQALYDEAKDTAKRAAEIGLGLPEMERQNALKAKNEREELNAQLALERSRHQEQRVLTGSLTSNQKAGAWAQVGQVQLIDVNKRMERHLSAIKDRIGVMAGPLRASKGEWGTPIKY